MHLLKVILPEESPVASKEHLDLKTVAPFYSYSTPPPTKSSSATKLERKLDYQRQEFFAKDWPAYWNLSLYFFSKILNTCYFKVAIVSTSHT